jgi:hypothetical protein
MSNVFANGNEISAKKDGNKSICAMPDVCLSPPSPPAGPVPIPYPNSSDASKTSDGSKTVKIGGDEVGLKNQSTYKNSNGDEAATKSLGMGVVSHNIQGPLKHAAWSMDVVIEGCNAIRHLDMTTQNHGTPTNVPGIDLGSLAPPTGDPECVELENKAREAVKNDTTNGTLPPGVAHVTAVDSNGWGYKSAQPADCIKSEASDGYSGEHSKDNHPCDGKPHNSNSQGNRNHCECKIMHEAVDGLGLKAGGSITMRVNWNVGGQPPELSNSPCQSCMGSICETAMECNIEIFICKGDPLEKKEAPCKQTKHKPGTQAHADSAHGRGHSNSWVGSGW